jgi:hypothetical protein
VEIMEAELRRPPSGLEVEDGHRQLFLVRARFTAEDPAQVMVGARGASREGANGSGTDNFRNSV